MSRLKSKSSNSSIDKLAGKVDIYHTRLGKYRYIIAYKSPVYMDRKMIVIRYTGEMVNNRLYGTYSGMSKEEIAGKPISLYDVPTELIEDAIKGMQK